MTSDAASEEDHSVSVEDFCWGDAFYICLQGTWEDISFMTILKLTSLNTICIFGQHYLRLRYRYLASIKNALASRLLSTVHRQAIVVLDLHIGADISATVASLGRKPLSGILVYDQL